jgi:hypothetical protein
MAKKGRPAYRQGRPWDPGLYLMRDDIFGGSPRRMIVYQNGYTLFVRPENEGISHAVTVQSVPEHLKWHRLGDA